MSTIDTKLGRTSSTRICPRCQYDEAFYEINFQTFEETLICDHCGYVRGIEAVVLEGKASFRVYEHRTAGAYGMHGEAIGTRGQLAEVPSEEEIEQFKQELAEKGATGYLNVWDEETKTVKCLVG